jgi:uncharacterized caspase-like protein
MASSSEDLSGLRKLALIIGNGDYSEQINKLDQSVENANEVVDVLKTMNFRVCLKHNIREDILERTQEFTDEFEIKDGDLILFYFSGHAYQVNGKNYLIPVDDTRIDEDEDVKDFSADVQRIIDRLTKNRPSCVTILILDCCRPYKPRNGPTSNGK